MNNTNETSAAMLLLASTVEANLRTLEAHTRSTSVGASMSVGCEVSRCVYKDSTISAPVVRWVVNLHLDVAHPEVLAHGTGQLFPEALADAQAQAATMMKRCPTCGNRHAAHMQAAPNPAMQPQDNIEARQQDAIDLNDPRM